MQVLMSNEGVSINAPLFVTWFQCIVTALICWLAGRCGARAQRKVAGYASVNTDEEGGKAVQQPQKPSFFSQFPTVEYSCAVARRVFPLSVIFVCMITFNNLCLKYVEVSFYNVARSMTIVFNVMFSYLMLRITSSCKTIMCLAIVVIGFFMGSQGEINFSLIGTVCGVLSSLFVSLNSIYTKKVRSIVQ